MTDPTALDRIAAGVHRHQAGHAEPDDVVTFDEQLARGWLLLKLYEYDEDPGWTPIDKITFEDIGEENPPNALDPLIDELSSEIGAITYPTGLRIAVYDVSDEYGFDALTMLRTDGSHSEQLQFVQVCAGIDDEMRPDRSVIDAIRDVISEGNRLIPAALAAEAALATATVPRGTITEEDTAP